MRRLRTVKKGAGYSMTTRKGQASTKSLLKRFGDAIFDASKDRGQGSGRENKKRR